MWKIHSPKYVTFPKGPYVFYFKRGCNLNERNKFSNDGISSNSRNIFGDRDFLDINLYYFPRVAVTNYCKLGGLQPQKFIFSWLWRPEVWNRGVSRAMLPLRALGKNPSCLFQPLVAADVPTSVVPHRSNWPPPHKAFSSVSTSLCLFKDIYHWIRAHLDIPG